MMGLNYTLYMGVARSLFKEARTFDYIPLLGLSIPIEFALSDLLKTVLWASCKLPVDL